MVRLPFLMDEKNTVSELRAVVALCEIAHEAIRKERLHKLRLHLDAGRGELERIQTQSSLLMAHAIFEFSIKQLIDEIEETGEFDVPKRKNGPYLTWLASRLAVVSDDLCVKKQPLWFKAFALAKIRNLIAHTTGFQDRDFEFTELVILGDELGIRHAISVTGPPLKTFVFEARSVALAVDVYVNLLGTIYSELKEWSAS